MNNNEVTLDAVCTLISAFLIAKEFPGIVIQASQEQPGTLEISHAFAPDLSRRGIEIPILPLVVNNMLLELQCRYGEHGEKLVDQPLLLELSVPLSGG